MVFKSRVAVLVWILILSIAGAVWAGADNVQPRQVVLTFQDCPSTTMTITWRTDAFLSDPMVIYSSQQDTDRSEEQYEVGRSVESAKEPGAWLNTVQLTGLTPGATYTAVIPASEPEQFTFRTAPDSPRNIVFIAGADSHLWPPGTEPTTARRRTNALAAEYDPDFILFAGDLWYGDPGYEQTYGEGVTIGNVNRWFDDWHESAVTASGGRIPIIPAEGNHDRDFFVDRFRLPEPQRWYVLQYGPDLTIITLNAGPMWSIVPGGPQAQWLESVLQQYQDSRWLIVQHHVGPYPAAREYDESWFRQIRQHWVPLYEKYGVDLVITGHDHVYIKTHPLRAGEIDPFGIRYLTVGGWSIGDRQPDLERWYIEEAVRGNGSFVKFTLSADANELHVVPINRQGVFAEPFVLSKRLITLPFLVTGPQLRLKLNREPHAPVRVAVLDEERQPIPGYSFEESVLEYAEQGEYTVRWGNRDLSTLAGRTVLLEIEDNEAELHSVFGDVDVALPIWAGCSGLEVVGRATAVDPVHTELTWNHVADRYRVVIATDPAMKHVVVDTWVDASRIVLDELHYSQTYFWIVGADAGVGGTRYPDLYDPVWNPEGPQELRTVRASSAPSTPDLYLGESILGDEIMLRWHSAEEVNFYTLYRASAAERDVSVYVEGIRRKQESLSDFLVEPGEMYTYLLVAENELGTASSNQLTVALEPPIRVVDERFSRGDFDYPWRTSGNWSFFTEAGTSLANLRAIFPTAMATIRLEDVCSRNYSLEMRFRINEWGETQFATLRLGASLVGRNVYQMMYWHSKSLLELQRRVGSQTERIASKGIFLEPGNWHTLGLVVRGDMLDFYFDGEHVGSGIDPQPPAAGAIELMVSNIDLDIQHITLYR